jgi:hypothetical protein
MVKKREIEQLQRKAQESLQYAQKTMVNPPLVKADISKLKQEYNSTVNEEAIKETEPEPVINSANTVVRHCNDDELEHNNNNKYTVENLITNLKIISNIKPTEKIYLNTNNIIQIDKSMCPAFSRYLYDRSRHLTIQFLKDIVNNILVCTDSILTNEQDEIESDTDYNSCTISNDFTEYNSDILQRFILEINKSYDGLDNLIKTYENDITIVSEIVVLKEKLSTRCVKINNILRIKKNI